MNWTKFQTYGLSSEKSFEMLCNQLFENWCKEEYGYKLLSFHIVNGAGGDGGVESYACIDDGNIAGLQAKWFFTSINDSQIKQIRKSIETAKKVRPNLNRYIVCVPRDLTSITARGSHNESERWEILINEMTQSYPDLKIELWNDTRITAELQKSVSVGIQKFWFENTEFDQGTFSFVFERAKKSWLSTKYVPDINAPGQIDKSLMNYIGDFSVRESFVSQLYSIITLCKSFTEIINELFVQPDIDSWEIKELLESTACDMDKTMKECEHICECLRNEYITQNNIDETVFAIPFESVILQIKKTREEKNHYYFQLTSLIKILDELSNIDFYNLMQGVNANLNNHCLLFLGNPGTGKTQGVSAFADKIIKQNYHIPILIQARGIPEQFSWRNIIIQSLGLSDSWSEEELWQALISTSNRNRFQDAYIQKKISISPKVLIIVDGLDESSSINKWIDRIKETEIITRCYSSIRFCFTSRPAPICMPVNNAVIIRLREDGDIPTYKLFGIYAEKYNISIHNCQWVRYALNTPLALKLFCELYKGTNVAITNVSEISMSELWRKKIDLIQMEFNQKEDVPYRNQYILLAIRLLSECFAGKTFVVRNEVLSQFVYKTRVSDELAERVFDHIELYGIISSICKKGTGIDLDTYEYYIGIQGYFDYAAAIFLLDTYKHPSLIDFSQYNEIAIDTLYCLAIISIQRYQYMIIGNSTIRDVISYYTFEELQYYSLQHADNEEAQKYKDSVLRFMYKSTNTAIKTVNRLILPLSRVKGHPLGIALLDEFLYSFEYPAHRDIYWSIPPFLPKSREKTWELDEPIGLEFGEDDEYYLNGEDPFDGIPIIYAWMLSNVNNYIRKKSRNALMIWAAKSPSEFYKLFQHFSQVNDPQIKSDLYSILMCIVYTCNDKKIIKDASEWIILNVLDPLLIDKNRDVSVRYYSTAIIKKAKMMGLYSEENIERYLPPYTTNEMNIDLDKKAFSGTRMGGYSAIDYDLARYVLIDYFEGCFNQWGNGQLTFFVQQYVKSHPECKGIGNEQFIISAAYAYIKKMGWNEKEFYDLSKDKSGGIIGGIDFSISALFPGATHGAKSRVMTVCEKCIWAARNYISGFFCDRLLYGEDKICITDYSILDDFVIPIQDIHVIDPENIPINRPWHIPESFVLESHEEVKTRESFIEHIKHAPEIDWRKWIFIDNSNGLYKIKKTKLLALFGYSCFYGNSGVETCLFMNSAIIPVKELERFITEVHDIKLFDKVCNPTEWDGSVDSSIYTTPKEICWFPWKQHHDSMMIDYFPGMDLHSAIDSCYYNASEYGDVSFYMPSSILREILGIDDTDGYLYYDKDKKVIAEYTISGEKWGTYQEYVLIDETKLINELKKHGLTIVWILQEMLRESEVAREKYGNKFYTKRRQYSIGYCIDGKIQTEKIIIEHENSKDQ